MELIQDGAVFLINNLHQLRSTLSLYPGTEQRLAELADTLNSRLVGLSKEQVSCISLLSRCSLLLGLTEELNSSPGLLYGLFYISCPFLQAAHLLASLALAPLLPLLEERDGTPLSTVPGCHPQVL